jgi:HPt (histidine-containing phosphotransfer) domain-containing protein
MNSIRSTHRRHATPGLNSQPDPNAMQASIHGAIEPVNDPSTAKLNERPIHFEDLVERCMGNLDLANRLLDQSQEILAEDLKQLEQSCSTGDTVEIPRLAHRLKGATANIGAYELSDVFARIETHGKAGETETLKLALLELESEWTRFLANVADLLDEK